MKNVPKLRFSGFSDEWAEKKIGELYDDLKAGSTPSKLKSEYFKGNVPWITSGELKSKYIYSTLEYITEEAKQSANLKLYDEGTLFIAITGLEAPGTRGSCAINKVKATTNQSCMAFQKSNLVNNEFTYYWYNLYGEYIGITYTQGTKQQSLNNKLVADLKISIPSIEEQEKIANFLTKVDKLIEKQDEKVNNLEQYKKGMMQKIFSQEIRFKKDDGGEYPEWEEKSISEIANLTSSKRIFLSDYVDSGVPFYRGKEITELKANKTPSDILYITEEKYKEIKESYGVPKIGDILLTAVGTLGNSYVINNEEPFYFKDGNLIWFKEISINSIFLDLYLSSPHGQKKVLDSAIGSTQKALTIVALNKIKIYIPNTEEQIKIANFLSKIDSIVEKEKEKLEELRVWKKGLLQGMFV
ncbi:MAG: restriction endonuclease subunit S [Clostridium sp.]|nr:restriction endonuclease subunit S [Clostridium sp.]